MRVLHVLHTTLPFLCGYSIRSDYILRNQKEQGLDPIAVSSAQQPDVTQEQESIHDIPHWRTPMQTQRLPPGLREWSLIQSLEKQLEKVVAQTKPDLIHAHSPMLVGLPALRVAQRHRIPLVYEIRDLWENASVDRGKFSESSLLYKAARNLETHVLKNAHATVTICEGLASAIAPRVRSEKGLFIVGNGVDTSRFTPTSEDAQFRARWNLQGKQVIAYIGTFQPYEGLHLLIDSIAAVQQQVPDAHLLIVGGGGIEEELRAQVRQKQLDSLVTFTGRLPHDEVGGAYSVARILAYPRTLSRTTALTTPLKPLEGMAMGKLVIVSDVPAMKELVRPGVTGLTFAHGNAEDLSRQCIHALQSPSDREQMEKAAREWVLTERNWPTLVTQYSQIYAFAQNQLKS